MKLSNMKLSDMKPLQLLIFFSYVAVIVNVVFAASILGVWFFREYIMAVVCAGNNTCLGNIDVVNVAAAIGRLDYISVLLAVLGLFLVFFTAASVLYTRSEANTLAERTAKTTATEVAKQITPESAKAAAEEWLGGNLGDILSEILKDKDLLKSYLDVVEETESEKDADENSEDET